MRHNSHNSKHVRKAKSNVSQERTIITDYLFKYINIRGSDISFSFNYKCKEGVKEAKRTVAIARSEKVYRIAKNRNNKSKDAEHNKTIKGEDNKFGYLSREVLQVCEKYFENLLNEGEKWMSKDRKQWSNGVCTKKQRIKENWRKER